MSKLQLEHTAQSIALVANTSWSIYNFRLGVIKALISARHKIYAVAPRDDYSDKLTAAGVTYLPIKIKAHSTSPIEDLKTLFRLRSIYKKHQFDLVIHYTIKMNLYGSLAARLLHIKNISVVTGLGRTFQFSGITQYLIKSVYKLSCHACSDLWFLNTEDRDRFVIEGLTKLKNTFILPSEGVNTYRFKGTPQYAKNRIITRFLFAGRLLKDKGILEFVEAAKQLSVLERKVKFEVVGFVNPNNSMSVSLADLEGWQKKGWINYLGSHEDIRPFINRADCIVFPSYYQEGVSRILLEAASMSRPIITTDHVGCRDVVDHMKNGMLIPVKSVDHLVQACRLFLNLPTEERLQMGFKGREMVKERFDERRIIDVYFERIFKVKEENQLSNKAS